MVLADGGLHVPFGLYVGLFYYFGLEFGVVFCVLGGDVVGEGLPVPVF